MPVQLFRLRGVPEDEADEIRQLLADHSIDFYETPAGNWGVSMPAIWLRNDAHLQRAKDLIDVYQEERAVRARQEYEQLKSIGRQRRLIDQIREHPLQFILYLAFAGLIIYFSTRPFLNIAD